MKSYLTIALGGALCLFLSPLSSADERLATPDEARKSLGDLAENSRKKWEGKTFEEFKAGVYKEPFPDGKYIVNGDTPIANEKLLKEFFERHVKNKPEACEKGPCEFTIMAVGGMDIVWNNAKKKALTYCVSTSFADRYARVIADMQAATAAWETVADIDFIHLSQEDGRCTASNNRVLFDVRPVNVHGQYLARAFFPNDGRPDRNVLIDESSFATDPNGNLQLVGILRHELGHTIGARHEHTRPDSGKCFEDKDWRPVTTYDPFSVMHYPQCNGQGDWSLRLTDRDKHGVACIYGPARGFVVDAAICPAQKSGVKTATFADQAVAAGEKRAYGPFNAKPGTPIRVVMQKAGTTPGDPDLYLKFDGPADLADYDCRPYTTGADEECEGEVPAGASAVGVMVHGYTAANFKLTATYTEPSGP